MPSLLIVTPTLGHSPWFSVALNSVASVGIPYEHIIVCPPGVLESVKGRAGNAKVVAEPVGSLGMYAAINHGIKFASSDWDIFCYINDDDYLWPDFRGLPFELIAKSNSIFYGKTHVINETGRSLFTGSYLPFGGGVGALIESGIMPFMQISLVIPRNTFKRLGFFDARFKYCGDFDFICRAVNQGVKFEFVNLFIGAFRVHGGQLSANLMRMSAERDVALRQLNVTDAFGTSMRRFGVMFFYRIWNALGVVERVSWFGRLRSESMLRTTP